MTVYSLYDESLAPLAAATYETGDTSNVNLSQQFTVASTVDCTGIRYAVPGNEVNQSATRTVILADTTNGSTIVSVLASADDVARTYSDSDWHWRTVTFATPVTLSSSSTYLAIVFCSGGRYVYNGGFWGSGGYGDGGLTNGTISAPDVTGALGSVSAGYFYSGTPAQAGATFAQWQSDSYMVDPLIDDGSAPDVTFAGTVAAVSAAAGTVTPSPAPTYITESTIVYGSTTLAGTLPAGITAGDYLLRFVASKPGTNDASTPAGWTNLGTMLGTTGTTGVDTGPMRITAFGRKADGTESGTVSHTITAGNSGWTQTVLLRNPTGFWDVTVGTGQDTAGGTSWSAAIGSLSFAPGDLCIVGSAIPTDVTTPAQFTAEAITAAGITFGTMTEISEPDTTTGNDCGGFIFRQAVTAGTATVTSTVTATASGTTTNVYGPTALVRVRGLASSQIGGAVDGVSSAVGTVAPSTIGGTVAGVTGATGTVEPAASTSAGTVAAITGAAGTLTKSTLTGTTPATSATTGTVAPGTVGGTVTGSSSTAGTLPRSQAAGTTAAVAGAAGTTVDVIGAWSSVVTANTPADGIAGTVAGLTATTGTLTRAALTGAVTAATTTTGTLPASTLTGTTAGLTALAGALPPSQVAGTIAATTTAAGALPRSTVAGTIPAVTTTAGTLTPGAGLSGTITATTQIAGGLPKSVVAGAVAAVSDTAGSLVQTGLTGAVTVTAGTAGLLPRSATTGTVTVTSATVGTVDRSTISGATFAVTAIAGLTSRSSLGGTILATASTTGILPLSSIGGVVAAIIAVRGTLFAGDYLPAIITPRIVPARTHLRIVPARTHLRIVPARTHIRRVT